MKRRDFLGSLLAGATLASLPTTYAGIPLAAPEPALWSAASLTAHLEKMFTCSVGPTSAFYETLASGEIIKAGDKLPTGTHVNRYIYETYVCGIEGGDAREAEARLAKHFYEHFSKVPAGKLVWRREPHFESQEIVEYGKTYLTQAQVEDKVWKFTELGNGRRKYDEHAQLVLPQDVELDFETGNYRYIKRKYTLHKMRMRLVLPEKYDEDVAAISELTAKEFGKTVRI